MGLLGGHGDSPAWVSLAFALLCTWTVVAMGDGWRGEGVGREGGWTRGYQEWACCLRPTSPLSRCLLPPPSLSGWLTPHTLPLQSSLMDLADVFTAPAPPTASDPWGGPAPMAAAIPTATSTSDPWGGPPAPPAADPWGGPAPTPASGDPWRPAAPAGPSVDPWGGTQAPAAGEGPTPDPWGSSDGEYGLMSWCSPDVIVQLSRGWTPVGGQIW